MAHVLQEPVGVGAAPGAHAPWFIETVDFVGDVGQYASVSVGPPWADPIFAYYDATNQRLRRAWPAAGSGGGTCGDNNDWICVTADSGGDVGKYSSVAALPDGTMLTAYHDATNRALKARIPYPADVTVDAAIAPASTGLFASAALASDGTPYIAYHFNNPGNVDALMIAYPGSGHGNCGVDDPAGYWDCYTVQIGEGVGQHASLALDGDGHFHIAYQNASSGDLWYATSRRAVNCGPGNSWHCYAVDSTSAVVGQYASIYVDSDDRFHTAYYDDTNGFRSSCRWL
jgi:hypothetical protein